eukprot:365307-Chlamydomonas_euryale.AAC.8
MRSPKQRKCSDEKCGTLLPGCSRAEEAASAAQLAIPPLKYRGTHSGYASRAGAAQCAACQQRQKMHPARSRGMPPGNGSPSMQPAHLPANTPRYRQRLAQRAARQLAPLPASRRGAPARLAATQLAHLPPAVDDQQEDKPKGERVKEIGPRRPQQPIRHVFLDDDQDHGDNVQHDAHHDVVARDMRDLLVAHDAEVGAEEDDQWRPLVDVEPVLKGLWGGAAARHGARV